MKRFTWITDPHLDTIKGPRLIEFLLELEEADSDGIFITGDISTGVFLERHLSYLDRIVKKPKYFILGNHDFYDSTMRNVKLIAARMSEKYKQLHYLSELDPITIADGVALIGHDGWYDAGWREPLTSLVFLWDWLFIGEFRKISSSREKMSLIKQTAQNAAEIVAQRLRHALKNHSTVYLLTHFPPWPEKDYVLGELADKFWMPYNSNRMMADALTHIMNEHSNKNLIVLAGHTHKKRLEQITSNIELRVGAGWHGKCEIAETITLNG